MKIEVLGGDIAASSADSIVVNLVEGLTTPGGATAAVDRALGGAIAELIAAGEIKGERNELTLIHTLGKLPARRVLVVGLGKKETVDANVVRHALAEALRRLRQAGSRSVATILHGAGAIGLSPEAAAQAIVEGALLGLYRFADYRRDRKLDPDPEELILIEPDAGKRAAAADGARRGEITARAACLARDLANQPANFMTPTDLASTAQRVASAHGLACTVLERAQMQELGMGALLGVAQGSAQPPKFIILEYRGNGSGDPDLALVGKGITFDTGGISIKPAEGMESMKTDMTGGATVIATLGAIAQLRPRLNVVGIVPATENMPSGTAYKPGDVVRAMNGKTIEVVNTDAEGRVILSDGLSYARQLKAARLVDIATLTGAMVVALGHHRTGAFTNNPEWLEQVKAAAERSGEKIWPMPLDDEYKDQIKSAVADLKNTGGRPAGSVTAALFLAAFAEDTPWVHLDIAGTARSAKQRGYIPEGSTGVPVRTLIEIVLGLAEAQAAVRPAVATAARA
jgi:leucyl aminopeptidase